MSGEWVFAASVLFMGNTAAELPCPPVPTSGSQRAVPNSLLDEIAALLPEGAALADSYPEFIAESTSPNILLSSEARIRITFVTEGATYQNAFGYFTFSDEGDFFCAHPVWPNASQVNGGGTLAAGDTVDLGMFAAGTNLGFYLISDGHPRGEEVPADAPQSKVFYSFDAYNRDGLRHVALIATQTRIDGQRPLILGFEDLIALGDADFNDAVFLVGITPEEALDEAVTNGDIPTSDFGGDTDGDGVINGQDDFPDDPTRAGTECVTEADCRDGGICSAAVCVLGKCFYEDVPGCSDTDADGVIDENDLCPGTAEGTAVDEVGCPADSPGKPDGDGSLTPDVDGDADLDANQGAGTGSAASGASGRRSTCGALGLLSPGLTLAGLTWMRLAIRPAGPWNRRTKSARGRCPG